MSEKIALLIPSRNRPNSIKSILEEYVEYGAGLTDFIIGVDEDDESLPDYISLTNDYRIEIYIGPRKRLGPTLNDMAMLYAENYPYLGFIGDDMRPRTNQWDLKVAKTLENLEWGFTHGDDGHWGSELATQVFVTSNIVKKLGFMVPPGMIHMYLDNFWSEFARSINRFEYLPDVLIEHLHPAWGKAEKDSLYEETNTSERMSADRILFEQYKLSRMNQDVEDVLRAIYD